MTARLALGVVAGLILYRLAISLFAAAPRV